MSSQKRKVAFDDETRILGNGDTADNEEEADEAEDEKIPFSKRFKHTLDSDEEDDEVQTEKYNIRETDEFEGEEDGHLRREEDIQITPFNMKEELEEGHVDKDGMYIFNKNKDEVKDHWLDNIDWVQIKEAEDEKVQSSSPKAAQDLPEEVFDFKSCYEKMLALMKPDETVQKAIKRLGNRPKGQKSADPNMMELITLADKVLTSGDMDIYERTFEQLTFKLKEKPKTDLDIFADDDDQVNQSGVTAFESEVVFWEFKWEDKDDAAIHGPFSNDQMLKWKSDGYFADGVFVRQVNKPNSTFNSSKRIDFDLYS